MDDVGDIQAFYDRSPGEEERLERHQLEWDITWRYLERYLPPQGRLLEAGAATGRYTRELARRGYHVTAVDLSPALTELAREKCRQEGLDHMVEYLVADARDLSVLRGRTFDAVLVMGPLYHLIEEADRRTVLRQVHPLLRTGGIIVSAFICGLGIWSDLMEKFPGLPLDSPGEAELVLRYGRDEPDDHQGGFRGYFARPEEMAPLHEGEGFATLAVAASEPAIGADDAVYNCLEGEQRQAWLDLLFRISGEPSMLGASRHLLYVGERQERASA